MKEGVVYSGSFNPFHIGHLAIVEELSKKFDYVLLVVSVQNPFKNEGKNNFKERLDNVRKVIEKKGFTNVFVEDIEQYLTAPYYTINTLNALQEKYPNDLLSYSMGADSLIGFDRWKDWEDILENFGLVIFPRDGYNHKEAITFLKKLVEDSEFWHLIVLDYRTPDISSTEIREKIKNGEDVSDLLP